MAEAKVRGRRKSRVGEVVKDRADKTVIVRVSRRVPHPLYGKVVQRSSKFAAHDETNDAHVGDGMKTTELEYSIHLSPDATSFPSRLNRYLYRS